MSINAKESLSPDIIDYIIMSRSLPLCDEIKITDYKLIPVNTHHLTAMVKLVLLNEGAEVLSYTEIFNCPMDIKEKNEDVRSFLYPMLEVLAMGVLTPKGTIDKALKTDDEKYKSALKAQTENYVDYMETVTKEEEVFRE